MPERSGFGSRLSQLAAAIARLSPRKKAVVGLLAVMVVLTWLAACVLLASLFA
ncbi:MAG: hypothetical protein M8467_16545 [Anaerolineae bacterium]|nr:hypothetical protein [Anaerolineae bacterium]